MRDLVNVFITDEPIVSADVANATQPLPQAGDGEAAGQLTTAGGRIDPNAEDDGVFGLDGATSAPPVASTTSSVQPNETLSEEEQLAEDTEQIERLIALLETIFPVLLISVLIIRFSTLLREEALCERAAGANQHMLDSPYFLGFLVTLISLVHAFYMGFNQEDPSSFLLRSAGIALFSSVVGLVARVAMLSQVQLPGDELDERDQFSKFRFVIGKPVGPEGLDPFWSLHRFTYRWPLGLGYTCEVISLVLNALIWPLFRRAIVCLYLLYDVPLRWLVRQAFRAGGEGGVGPWQWMRRGLRSFADTPMQNWAGKSKKGDQLDLFREATLDRRRS